MSGITNVRPVTYTIGEIARLTAVNIETIRYYERIRILPAPRRSDGGRRLYGSHEKRVLAFIRRSRELGFTLGEIRALIALGAPGDASCDEVREIATAHLANVREKISDLQR